MNAQFLIPTIEVPQVKTGLLTKTALNMNDFFARETGDLVPLDKVYRNLVVLRDFGDFYSYTGSSYFRFVSNYKPSGWKRIRLAGAYGIPMEAHSRCYQKRKFQKQVNCLFSVAPICLHQISTIYFPQELLYQLKGTLKTGVNVIKRGFHSGFVQVIDRPEGAKQLHIYGFIPQYMNARKPQFTMEPNPQWLYEN